MCLSNFCAVWTLRSGEPSRMNGSPVRLVSSPEKSSGEIFTKLDYFVADSASTFPQARDLRRRSLPRERITSGSCKRPLAAASRPRARGQSSRCPGHSREHVASFVCGTWPRSADSESPDRRRRDFAPLSQSSPPGPPAWSTCSRSRCTTGNWSANHIAWNLSQSVVNVLTARSRINPSSRINRKREINRKVEYMARRIRIKNKQVWNT